MGRNRTHYEFQEDLKAYANLKVPIIPALLPVLQKLMNVLYLREKSDENVKVSSRKVTSADGASLRVLLYEPVNAQKKGGCLLFIHGGGFVFQAAPHHFQLARKLAKELGYKTVFADYRLAPKYKYPAAPEDCYCIYQWILEHAKELEIDTARIAVCGDSAGGNLAAVLCQMAKKRGIQLPGAQMLLYPVTDRRLITDSVKRYTDTPMCNSADMKKYYELYVGQHVPENITLLSPVEAEQLEGLPRAYIEVAEFDCLRDEGIAYAEALRAVGTSVEQHEVKGAMHGYDIAANSGLLKKWMARRVSFLRKI